MERIAYNVYVFGEAAWYWLLVGLIHAITPVMAACLTASDQLYERAERHTGTAYHLLMLVRGWTFLSGVYLFLLLSRVMIARERILGHESCIADIERERDKIRAAVLRPGDG